LQLRLVFLDYRRYINFDRARHHLHIVNQNIYVLILRMYTWVHTWGYNVQIQCEPA